MGKSGERKRNASAIGTMGHMGERNLVYRRAERAMKNVLIKYNLPLFSLLAVFVLGYTLVSWSSISVAQRMLGLFAFAITLHLWEEGRFPGGFTEMIAEKLHFKPDDLHFGQIITSCYVIFIVFIPLLFPGVTFLVLAPMLLGILEVVAHTAAIKMFGRRYYSPGLATAVVVLLPISIYTIRYVQLTEHPGVATWAGAFLYMAVGLLIAQRIVINASGMSYRAFLCNVRSRLFSGK